MQNKGCITCKKCEQVRLNFYCGRKKLSQKQLYNKYGFCTRYEPVEQKPQTNEEWFCGLSTSAKSDFMAKMVTEAIKEHSEIGATRCESVIWWDKWLKEAHNG